MHFLIDYENTGLAGLEGIKKLKRGDSLYIFSNQAHSQIPISSAIAICRTHCFFDGFTLVNTRKNALDFYIAAKAGEIAGRDEDIICVISNDQGFVALKDYIETYINGRMVCAQNILIAIEEAKQTYDRRVDCKGINV